MPENIKNFCICISYILTTYEVHTIILILPVRSQGAREQIQIAHGDTVIQTCTQNCLTPKAMFFMIELFDSPSPVTFLPYFLKGKFRSLCERKVQVIEGSSRLYDLAPNCLSSLIYYYELQNQWILYFYHLTDSSYDMDFTTVSLCLCR